MDNYDNIRSEAKKATEIPPSSAWSRIEDKLDNKANLAKNAKRKLVRNLLSLTTIMLLLLASVYVYQETNKNPELSKGNIASWEDLDSDEYQRFDQAKVQLLNTAYKSIDQNVLLKRASW